MNLRCAICRLPVPPPQKFPAKSGLLGNHVFLAPEDGSPVTVFAAYCDSHLTKAKTLFPPAKLQKPAPDEAALYIAGTEYRYRNNGTWQAFRQLLEKHTVDLGKPIPLELVL